METFDSKAGAADYDDAFATCARTYAALVIWREALDLAEVRTLLGTDLIVARGSIATLTTEQALPSLDLRRHLDWITEKLTPASIQGLREEGYDARVSAYWLSAHGHGGPILSPR